MKPLFAPWFDNRGAIDTARAMLVIIQRTMYLLDRQLERLGDEFLDKGGFKERMHACRTEVRDAAAAPVPDAPPCPDCARPMRKRFPRNDSGSSEPFWGCPGFPKCRGTRRFEKE
ncbi:MAG: four helix bundle suffix domain-containing protein [Lentisphaeria bacterium]|nr:four helix bundle suffix domain-containing protein [Lentisphaeria bacterium]